MGFKFGDKEYDLTDPKQAREFLKEVRIGKAGGRVLYLRTADGVKIPIDKATDKQILSIVAEMVEKH